MDCLPRLKAWRILISNGRISGEPTQQSKDSTNKLTFFDVQKAFYSQLKNINSKEIDGPYQKFKRWEWYWENRIDSSGNFPTLNQIIETKKTSNVQKCHQ